MSSQGNAFLTVAEAGRALGVSESTVWRMIRRGELTSTRRGGRRLVSMRNVERGARQRQEDDIPAFRRDHPLFRLVGAGHGGGQAPGARDKHGILDR